MSPKCSDRPIAWSSKQYSVNGVGRTPALQKSARPVITIAFKQGVQAQRHVARHRGAIVPIDGFDELMAMLGHRLNFPRMDQLLEQRARERVQRYRSSFEAFQQRLQLASEAPPEAEASAQGPVEIYLASFRPMQTAFVDVQTKALTVSYTHLTLPTSDLV